MSLLNESIFQALKLSSPRDTNPDLKINPYSKAIYPTLLSQHQSGRSFSTINSHEVPEFPIPDLPVIQSPSEYSPSNNSIIPTDPKIENSVPSSSHQSLESLPPPQSLILDQSTQPVEILPTQNKEEKAEILPAQNKEEKVEILMDNRLKCEEEKINRIEDLLTLTDFKLYGKTMESIPDWSERFIARKKELELEETKKETESLSIQSSSKKIPILSSSGVSVPSGTIIPENFLRTGITGNEAILKPENQPRKLRFRIQLKGPVNSSNVPDLSKDVVYDRPDIDQNWTICQIVEKQAPPGWKEVFHSRFHDFQSVSEWLENVNSDFYPLKKHVFRAFDLCPLNNVKVVIVGQDPYHSTQNNGLPVAQGMSFSVPKNAPIPSSLKNIFKELKDTVNGWTVPSHGDLTAWALQGVLLLNTCLTVKPAVPKSHGGIWHFLIDIVVKAINSVNPKCIFVLWGREAEKLLGKFLTNKNIMLTAAHPSGLSANRGFFGCNHFNLINKHLEETGKTPINWNL